MRSLIAEQSEDNEIGIFAEQLLTAKSWYRGADSAVAEKVFAEMIDATVLGQDEIQNIINLAAGKIAQTVENKNE